MSTPCFGRIRLFCVEAWIKPITSSGVVDPDIGFDAQEGCQWRLLLLDARTSHRMTCLPTSVDRTPMSDRKAQKKIGTNGYRTADRMSQRNFFLSLKHAVMTDDDRQCSRSVQRRRYSQLNASAQSNDALYYGTIPYSASHLAYLVISAPHLGLALMQDRQVVPYRRVQWTSGEHASLRVHQPMRTRRLGSKVNKTVDVHGVRAPDVRLATIIVTAKAPSTSSLVPSRQRGFRNHLVRQDSC